MRYLYPFSIEISISCDCIRCEIPFFSKVYVLKPTCKYKTFSFWIIRFLDLAIIQQFSLSINKGTTIAYKHNCICHRDFFE